LCILSILAVLSSALRLRNFACTWAASCFSTRDYDCFIGLLLPCIRRLIASGALVSTCRHTVSIRHLVPRCKIPVEIKVLLDSLSLHGPLPVQMPHSRIPEYRTFIGCRWITVVEPPDVSFRYEKFVVQALHCAVHGGDTIDQTDMLSRNLPGGLSSVRIFGLLSSLGIRSAVNPRFHRRT